MATAQSFLDEEQKRQQAASQSQAGMAGAYGAANADAAPGSSFGRTQAPAQQPVAASNQYAQSQQGVANAYGAANAPAAQGAAWGRSPAPAPQPAAQQPVAQGAYGQSQQSASNAYAQQNAAAQQNAYTRAPSAATPAQAPPSQKAAKSSFQVAPFNPYASALSPAPPPPSAAYGAQQQSQQNAAYQRASLNAPAKQPAPIPQRAAPPARGFRVGAFNPYARAQAPAQPPAASTTTYGAQQNPYAQSQALAQLAAYSANQNPYAMAVQQPQSNPYAQAQDPNQLAQLLGLMGRR
jgi:hypothetical protein